MKTRYLWDQVGTLIQAEWDPLESGFPDYVAYARFVSDGESDRDPFVSGQLYERTYDDGLFRLTVADGALEATALPGDHRTVSSGVPDEWRWMLRNLSDRRAAEVLAEHIRAVYSTFEFGYRDTKDPDVFCLLFHEASEEACERVVYTDDKLRYCEAALLAAKAAKLAVTIFWIRVDPTLQPPDGIIPVRSPADVVQFEPSHHD